MPVKRTSHGSSKWIWMQLMMFLDQLDETPAGGSGDSNHTVEKSSKLSKKHKPSHPWFMLPKQKHPQLDVSEVSSDQSSDEPLGESSLTSSPNSNSSSKRSRCCKKSKRLKLKSGMFAKHTSTIKKPQLWPHNHLNPHVVSNMPKFQDISWDQLVAGEVTIILQAKYCTQAMGRHHLLK